MNTCGYCGKENTDDANACSGCGTSFSEGGNVQTWSMKTMMDDLTQFPSLARKFLQLPVPWFARLVLWLVAWGSVIRSAFQHNPEDLRSSLGFPVGFFGLLPAETSIYFVMFGGWAALIIGWVLYALISVVIVASKPLGRFSLFYIAFCGLLALNLTGCRKLIETASGIH